MMASMTDDTSTYINDASNLLKESYQELLEVNNKLVKEKEIAVNLTQNWIAEEHRINVLKTRNN